jgi:hypothetical protein
LRSESGPQCGRNKVSKWRRHTGSRQVPTGDTYVAQGE